MCTPEQRPRRRGGAISDGSTMGHCFVLLTDLQTGILPTQRDGGWSCEGVQPDTKSLVGCLHLQGTWTGWNGRWLHRAASQSSGS